MKYKLTLNPIPSSSFFFFSVICADCVRNGTSTAVYSTVCPGAPLKLYGSFPTFGYLIEGLHNED